MESTIIGKRLRIHAYKHNGDIYKSWNGALVLDETDDMLVVANNHARVEEAKGRVWYTNETAVIYFYKKEWHNVVVQMKPGGASFYCNIASPFVMDDEVIKYIDYDIDLRVYPTGKYRVLDRNEYAYHRSKYEYPDEIDGIVEAEVSKLQKLAREQAGPFDKDMLAKYYSRFLEMENKDK